MRAIIFPLVFLLVFPLPAFAEMGPNPALATPDPQIIPTINIPDIVGWAEGETPVAPEGFRVTAFARDLDHPRWLLGLPNGDVLVAESNAPERGETFKGIKGFITRHFMKKAGGAGRSANRISLLRDADGDGLAETRSVFLENLNSPIGMALVGGNLYVANTDAVLRFPYLEGNLNITTGGERIAGLPAGARNHHWTKSLAAPPDGSKLYVGVGSNSNIAENGMEEEENRAAILEIDVQTGNTRLYASGLRNPVGLDFNPETGELWAAVNERDLLGDELVPDYMTSVKEGAFYGWPYSYFGQNVDTRVKPQRPDLVERAIMPDYALGAHTASLGLTFYTGGLFPARYMNGAFIGQHGSWNRKKPAGYKVVFVPFENGRPAGAPEDFLTGFLREDGKARGRPAGVAVDAKGALLVADDGGNIVWRVSR